MGGKFDVFTRETMLDRWHFAHNDRIAPIYVVPKEGYVLTDHIENGAGMSKGVSSITTRFRACGSHVHASDHTESRL